MILVVGATREDLGFEDDGEQTKVLCELLPRTKVQQWGSQGRSSNIPTTQNTTARRNAYQKPSFHGIASAPPLLLVVLLFSVLRVLSLL